MLKVSDKRRKLNINFTNFISLKIFTFKPWKSLRRVKRNFNLCYEVLFLLTNFRFQDLKA